VALLLLAGGVARAQDSGFKSSPKVLEAFRPVVARPSQSTAVVRCDGKDVALGTVVGADGWILTKASELKGKAVCKLKDGRELTARVVGVHEKYDLALLRIDATGLKPVEWRNSKKAAVGNWLATPGTGTDPVAVGVVSVATRKPGPRDLPPALPAPGAGYLGVALAEDEGGARITRVESGSPADKAGLQADDIVVAVAGRRIVDAESLVNAVGRFKPGSSVKIKIKREGKPKEFEATLGKRPITRPSRGDIQNRMGGPLSNKRGGFPIVLQHDTVLLPRECGGPLVDLDGKAVGVNIARAGRTESYAVPSEVVQKLLPDLMSGKLAPPKEEGDR
jgi:serine protease Do